MKANFIDAQLLVTRSRSSAKVNIKSHFSKNGHFGGISVSQTHLVFIYFTKWVISQNFYPLLRKSWLPLVDISCNLYWCFRSRHTTLVNLQNMYCYVPIFLSLVKSNCFWSFSFNICHVGLEKKPDIFLFSNVCPSFKPLPHNPEKESFWNTVGKWENAGNQSFFSFFPQCFLPFPKHDKL